MLIQQGPPVHVFRQRSLLADPPRDHETEGGDVLRRRVLLSGGGQPGGVHADPVRIVAFEVGGVHADAVDECEVAQLQHHPVVARLAPAARFPAVAHVDPLAGHDDVAHGAKVFVVAQHRPPAVFHGGEIQQLRTAHLAPVAVGVAVHPQARHAPVRIDFQPQMVPDLRVFHIEQVVGVALQRGDRDDLGPAGALVRRLFRITCLQGGLGRVVAREVPGVHIDRPDQARHS